VRQRAFSDVARPADDVSQSKGFGLVSTECAGEDVAIRPDLARQRLADAGDARRADFAPLDLSS
jgi:hypothetical protein